MAGILESLTNDCSPFFITGSISSVFFGEKARKRQIENAEEGIIFRERLHEIKERFEQEKMDTEIRFKRENLELGRYYQQIEAKKSFDDAQKADEFKLFVNCWPLTYEIRTIWDQVKFFGTTPELLVILSKSNDSDMKAGCEYSNACAYLSERTKGIQNIKVLSDPWSLSLKTPVGSMAQNMNIHYIMQGIPTMVITPKRINDNLYFDTSIWNHHRGLGSFTNLTLFAMPYDDTYEKLKPKIRLVQLAIVGVLRDHFMMLEFHQPACFPLFLEQLEKDEKEVLAGFPELSEFLVKQYENIKKGFLTPHYKGLCTEGELVAMQESLNPIIEQKICQ